MRKIMGFDTKNNYLSNTYEFIIFFVFILLMCFFLSVDTLGTTSPTRLGCKESPDIS